MRGGCPLPLLEKLDMKSRWIQECDPCYPELRKFLELGESRGSWTAATAERFHRGSQIFMAGESADAVYLLLRGKVRIYGISPAGRSVIFWLARPGEFIGLAEVVGTTYRQAYAMAPEEIVALRLPRREFSELIHTDREVAEAVLAQLGRRLRVACEKTLAFATAPVKVRLCRMLLLLLDDADVGNWGRAGGERHSQQELAEMIGASRQSVNEILMELRAAGFISIHNSRISLRDRAALLDEAERLFRDH